MDELDSRRFGRYLRCVREDRKLSLDTVEEMTTGYPDRVTKSHLSRIENGSAVPSFGKMFALSQVYGIPIAALAERFEMDLLREISPVEKPPTTAEAVQRLLEQYTLTGDYAGGLSMLAAIRATGSPDIGDRIDVWVRAPDLSGFAPSPPPWVILGGPDPLFQLSEWDAISSLHAQGAKVLTVPLATWQRAVETLGAPPSAGVMLLAWIGEILGGHDDVSAAGFQVRADDVEPGAYHQALRKHIASSRHRWPVERRLLARWQAQGLTLLG